MDDEGPYALIVLMVLRYTEPHDLNYLTTP